MIKNITASSHIIKFKKKSNKKFQLEIDVQIKIIINNPDIGELKKGDLAGVKVHKFKFNKQLYLLSYEVINETLNLYTIGTHENYYRTLKNFFK
jgi:mRNA interferase RelE/StbE